MSNLNVSSSNRLMPPVVPQQPLKTQMPPQVQRSRSLTQVQAPKTQSPQVSESQEVVKSLKLTTPKKLRRQQQLINQSMNLSDVSGQLQHVRKQTPQQQLLSSFKDLKTNFTLKTNRLKNDGTDPVQDVFLMRFNPRANSKDKLTSRMLDAYSYKEYSNENTEFLKYSRKLVKMGLEHPNFDRHLKTSVEHFVRPGSEREINVSSKTRTDLMSAYEDFKQNPSLENKSKVLGNYTKAVKEVYDMLSSDTYHRFKTNKNEFTHNVKDTKAGRLWRNYRADHKNWRENIQPWKVKGSTVHNMSNFFKAWGSFSKVTANFFFMQQWYEPGIEKRVEVSGKKFRLGGSNETAIKDKTALLQAMSFNRGTTAPRYSDYNF